MPAVTQRGSAVIKANNFVKTLPTGSAVSLLKRDRKACVKIFLLLVFCFVLLKNNPPSFLPLFTQLSALVRLKGLKGMSIYKSGNFGKKEFSCHDK